MSLVAYAASSDEESDYNDSDETLVTSNNASQAQATTAKLNGNSVAIGGISDDDEDYAPTEYVPLSNVEQKPLTLTLPKPKHETTAKTPDEEMDAHVMPTFAKLPMPKHTTISNVIEEEDDEFLHKKATIPIGEIVEKPPPPPPTTANIAKGPVKITVPSLKEFTDVEQELANKIKNKAAAPTTKKTSGLLSILPIAKSEQNFAKTPGTTPIANVSVHTKPVGAAVQPPAALPIKANPFIPDTVKNRRPAHNTEFVDGIKRAPKRHPTKDNIDKSKISLVNCSDSEESDEEAAGAGDFFSLNAEEKLPEVSVNEINAMVAQRAAKIATAGTNYINALETKPLEDEEQTQLNEEMLQAQKHYQESQLDQAAVQALVGNSAKRRRKEKDIQVLDISSEQVLPNRDEWMRTALASSTAYQATGVLTDEEPAAGTRRKHQITYLAHKAKANEAELQAMWATNRQNRRATQSKYGF